MTAFAVIRSNTKLRRGRKKKALEREREVMGCCGSEDSQFAHDVDSCRNSAGGDSSNKGGAYIAVNASKQQQNQVAQPQEKKTKKKKGPPPPEVDDYTVRDLYNSYMKGMTDHCVDLLCVRVLSSYDAVCLEAYI